MESQNHPFMVASKMKLRFPTTRGSLQVDDLWDLALKDLDTLAVAADAAIEKAGGKSFLENPDRRVTAERAEHALRLEVLKIVIESRQAENKATRTKAELAARRQFLMGLKEKKQIDQLESLSVEEIDAQLAALGADESAGK